MIEICQFDKCTGCGLCSVRCPKKAISMKEGKIGHLYPNIDQKRCVDCGLCLKVCPSININPLVYPKKAFAAFAKDEDDYKSSTSGGVASILSTSFINKGGVVYGCSVVCVNDLVDICHIRCTTADEIKRLKGSKYVQSRITDILTQLKNDVFDGIPVLFVGTPCQVAAVRNLFPINKNYENLLLVDVICHGVPSLSILRNHIKAKVGNRLIQNIKFRSGDSMCLTISQNENLILYSCPLWEKRFKDVYYNAFIDGFTYRDSCHNCQYARSERIGDITIGDFWGLGKKDDVKDIAPHPNGISVILPNTEKGIRSVADIAPLMNIYERDVCEAIAGNDQLRAPKFLNKKILLFKIIYPLVGLNAYYIANIFQIIKYKLRKLLKR